MVDAVLLIASIDRPIRFLMFKGSYDHLLVKAVCPDHEGDSDLVTASSARDDSVVAHRDPGLEGRRGGMHFSRRPDDSHRPDAALPPRHGKNRERPGGADHSGESRRRLGIHLQLRAWKVSVEDAAANSVSSDGDVRQAGAGNHQCAGSAAGRAGTRRRGLSLPQALYADAASLVRTNGAAASLALCHGGRLALRKSRSARL